MSRIFCIIGICMSIIPIATAKDKVEYFIPAVCSSSEEFVELISKYSESPVFIGEDTQNADYKLKVIVFNNEETNTYTITLISKEENRACSVSSGHGILISKTAEPL